MHNAIVEKKGQERKRTPNMAPKLVLMATLSLLAWGLTPSAESQAAWRIDRTKVQRAFLTLDATEWARQNSGLAPSTPRPQASSGAWVKLLAADPVPTLATQPRTALIGIGDSLTHGTMDATNNRINTANAYLQKVAESLAAEFPLLFSQPYFNEQEKRISPFLIPTNVAVDGDDIFSLAGLEYYKRAGVNDTVLSPDLLADRLLPAFLKDTYDKVIYPINLLTRKPTSQLDAAIWLMNQGARLARAERVVTVFWEGNNDSSLAALGGGGSNPQFQPIPFEVIKDELKPGLRLLLDIGEQQGAVSFAPYTREAIERNLTTADDFAAQYEGALNRFLTETAGAPVESLVLAVTLPYYSAVGYLMDSEDLEFYLRKIDPAYTVPPTFARVAPPGSPIVEPLRGDRVSLLTFGMMYAYLSAGHTVAEVNQVLDVDGVQRDGLVLSEAEQQVIMARIDAFNDAIRAAAVAHAPTVQLADVGGFLNESFLGTRVITVGDRTFSRKWIRGNGFTLDGVHPGYTGQALIANLILAQLNELLEIDAQPLDLEAVLHRDPYIDWDGDGWAAGPDYAPSGITSLLFMLKDPDDTDPGVEVAMPANTWDLISDTLLAELLHIPALRQEAQRLGLAVDGK